MEVATSGDLFYYVIVSRVFFPTKQSSNLRGDCFATYARNDISHQTQTFAFLSHLYLF